MSDSLYTTLGPDIYYTIKDEDGIIRPVAGLWPSNAYGREDAEDAARKMNSTVITIKIKEEQLHD